MFGTPLPPPWERSVTQRSCPRRPTAAPLALRSRGEAELKWKLECAAAHGKAAAIAERHLSDAEGSYAKLMYEQDKLERLVHLLDNPNVERVLKAENVMSRKQKRGAKRKNLPLPIKSFVTHARLHTELDSTPT